MTISNISAKASGPVVTKFHTEPSGAEEIKICVNGPGPGFTKLFRSTKFVVVLLFYVHGKHLRSCREGQLT